MPNSYFWGSEIDSLELVAKKLCESSSFKSFDSNEDRYIQPVLKGQHDSVYGKSVSGRASKSYENFASLAINPEKGDKIEPVKLFEDVAAEAENGNLVLIISFRPVIGFFEEFYIVASEQKNIGIYVNGKLVGYTSRLKPSIDLSMLAGHMPAMPCGELIAFCKSATFDIDKCLRRVYPF